MQTLKSSANLDQNLAQNESPINVVSRVVAFDKCIGCGVCAATCPSDVLSMQMAQNGQFYPRQIPGCNPKCDVCLRVCPFYEKPLFEDKINEQIWGDLPNFTRDLGRFRGSYVYYKADENERLKSASGGAGHAIFSELFEQNLIDYAICAMPYESKNLDKKSLEFDENLCKQNRQFINEISTEFSPNFDEKEQNLLFKFQILSNKNELNSARKSAYYPLNLEETLKFILKTDARFAISALPCFAKALRLGMQKNARLKKRICFIIGLVCGQGKSANFTKKVANLAFENAKLSHDNKQISIQNSKENLGTNCEEFSLCAVDFRTKFADKNAMQFGFTFHAKNGAKAIDTREKSAFNWWSSRAFTPRACNYCVDVFAKCADVVLMDAWLEPYFRDFRGHSLVLTRNEKIDEIFTKFCINSQNESENLTQNKHRKKDNKTSDFCEQISSNLVLLSQNAVTQNKNDIFFGTKNPLKRFILRKKMEIQTMSGRNFDCDIFVEKRIKSIKFASKISAQIATARYIFCKIINKIFRKTR